MFFSTFKCTLTCTSVQVFFPQNLLIYGPFMLSLTWISRTDPFAEKHPQSMMFPPQCFTVGKVFLGCNSALFFLQTRVEFLPKSSILVSSDHMTFSQLSSGSFTWSWANFRQTWTCAGLSRGALWHCRI